MGTCRSCGSTNDEGRITCEICGEPLAEPDVNGLAALRRLASLDQPAPQGGPAPSTIPLTEDRSGNVAETAPDWLESLMARYHEAIPSFGSESAPATEPAGQRAAPPAQASPGAASPRPPETPAPAEVPDWLINLRRAGSGAPVPPPAEKEAAEIPDWVRSLGQLKAEELPPPPEAESAAAPAEDEAPESVPDWLAQLITPSTPAASSIGAVGSPEVSASQPPDWLQEMDRTTATGPLGAAAGAEPAAPAGQPAVISQPELEPGGWLDLLSDSQAAAAAPAVERVPPRPEPAPPEARPAGTDRLTELRSSAQPAAEGQTGDLSWLAGLDAATAAAPPVTEALAAPSTSEEIPDWLRELASAAAQPEGPASTPFPATVAGDSSPAETLDRMRGPKLEAGPEVAPAGRTQVPPAAALGPVTPLADRLGTSETSDVPGSQFFQGMVDEQPAASFAPSQPAPGSRLFRIITWGLVFLAVILAILIVLLAVLRKVENLLGVPVFRQFLQAPAATGWVNSAQSLRNEIATLLMSIGLG